MHFENPCSLGGSTSEHGTSRAVALSILGIVGIVIRERFDDNVETH